MDNFENAIRKVAQRKEMMATVFKEKDFLNREYLEKILSSKAKLNTNCSELLNIVKNSSNEELNSFIEINRVYSCIEFIQASINNMDSIFHIDKAEAKDF